MNILLKRRTMLYIGIGALAIFFLGILSLALMTMTIGSKGVISDFFAKTGGTFLFLGFAVGLFDLILYCLRSANDYLEGRDESDEK